MDAKFSVVIMDDVLEFVEALSVKEQNKILGAINLLGNKKFKEVYVKQLTNILKELKVKKYRLIFFIHRSEIYFIRIFIKKSNKTPKLEIESASKFYKSFIQFNQNI
ncbi:type II toxin-antitoxin system RelE/ParE family toxin [Candidatus Nomurabacteria bacterium]|nr:type II toxin-antitoxin system RelE/ParE family toxin [Candidatus Nomurabacteria bacterium]